MTTATKRGSEVYEDDEDAETKTETIAMTARITDTTRTTITEGISPRRGERRERRTETSVVVHSDVTL